MKSNKWDEELKGRATVFDGAETRSAGEECVFTAERYSKDDGDGYFFSRDRQTWAGVPRPVKNWADFGKMFAEPWQEGIETVEFMRNALLAADWPKPKTPRRRRRYNDADGDLEIDRLLDGDDNFMRTFKRELTNSAHEVISLVTFIGGSCRYKAEDLFWQGAAAVAVTDLLEQAGFSCENWVYFTGTDAFYGKGKTDVYFSAIEVKEAGQPVDIDVFAKLTSGWFFRMAVLGSFWLHGRPNVIPSYGVPMTGEEEKRHRWVDKYLGIRTGVRRISVKAGYSMSEALANAKAAIATLISPDNLEVK